MTDNRQDLTVLGKLPVVGDLQLAPAEAPGRFDLERIALPNDCGLYVGVADRVEILFAVRGVLQPGGDFSLRALLNGFEGREGSAWSMVRIMLSGIGISPNSLLAGSSFHFPEKFGFDCAVKAALKESAADSVKRKRLVIALFECLNHMLADLNES